MSSKPKSLSSLLQSNNMIFPMVEAKTENQQKVFDLSKTGKHLLLHGVAGTGKTFLSIFLALKYMMDHKDDFNRLIIVRSVVPTRDIGFLPGSIKEKINVYELPYKAIINELFDRNDAYDLMVLNGFVEFVSTSFVRGLTFNNSCVIIDEIQNMVGRELDSVITRIGKSCKLFFCGDISQSDFDKQRDKEGVEDFMRILNSMHYFNSVEFGIPDICRSGLVREYLEAKEQLNINF